MKKYFLFLLVVISTFAFVSCSSSNDDDVKSLSLSKSEIVGTWIGTDKLLRSDTLIFLSNNECSLASFALKDTGANAYRSVDIKLNGTYQIDGAQVKITWKNKREYSVKESRWEEMQANFPTATFERATYYTDEMIYTGEFASYGSSADFKKLK